MDYKGHFDDHVLRLIKDHIYWAYHPILSKFLYKNLTQTYNAVNYSNSNL